MTLSPTTSPQKWIDSYGYEYASPKDFLLREKAKTDRNRTLAVIRQYHSEEGYIQAWIEGYDYPTTGNHYTRRRNAEIAAISWVHEGPGSSASGDGPACAGPSPHDAVRAAVQPKIPAGVGP